MVLQRSLEFNKVRWSVLNWVIEYSLYYTFELKYRAYAITNLCFSSRKQQTRES